MRFRDSFSFERDEQRIAAETLLDGIYVVRTRLPAETLDTEQTVLAYKSLASVEPAFRCIKTVDLKVQPIFHRLADRVRAHLLVCMLAYYVEWHLRRALAPLLFDDDDKADAAVKSHSVVQKAQRSDGALRKIATKRTTDGELPEFDKITQPTPLQQRAFDLLGVRHHR